MRRNRTTPYWGLCVVALLASGCGARSRDDIRGGESHFLKACESTCGGGLSCIDKKCTLACDGRADCTGLADDAVCVGPENEATCNLASTTQCEEEGRYYKLNDSWECANGCGCTCTEQGVRQLLVPCDSGSTPGDQCTYEGETYEVGDQWPCSDGCNTCFCTEDGVANTDVACTQNCEYEGGIYAIGDEWTCSDGCNTCFCTEDGVESTLLACVTCEYEGTTYEAGDEWTCSDGCNDCTCLDDGSVSATERACSTCFHDGRDYIVGETIEFGEGATCVCQEDGLVGECTGLPDGGPSSTSSASPEPVDGGPGSIDRERCYLPPDSGVCAAAFPAIYFDASSGQCLQFLYGGCGGNANRFDNLSDCYAACGGDAF